MVTVIIIIMTQSLQQYICMYRCFGLYIKYIYRQLHKKYVYNVIHSRYLIIHYYSITIYVSIVINKKLKICKLYYTADCGVVTNLISFSES